MMMDLHIQNPMSVFICFVAKFTETGELLWFQKKYIYCVIRAILSSKYET